MLEGRHKLKPHHVFKDRENKETVCTFPLLHHISFALLWIISHDSEKDNEHTKLSSYYSESKANTTGTNTICGDYSLHFANTSWVQKLVHSNCFSSIYFYKVLKIKKPFETCNRFNKLVYFNMWRRGIEKVDFVFIYLSWPK